MRNRRDHGLGGTRKTLARTWRTAHLAVLASFSIFLFLIAPTTAHAQEEPTDPATEVDTEAELRRAWADPSETSIKLTADIFLRQCKTGDPIRESAYPMLLDGADHTIRQTCFEKRVLRQDGTGYLHIKDIMLTRGGSAGPGAALTSRGEIEITGSRIQQNLAEEPGGGVFSQRRITVRDSVVTNNLANDDGGGLYARRGGVQVYDSVVSNNLVDGSGGAIGSTGDILLVRSRADGNTTDGDGGALYTDEDGDVTRRLLSVGSMFAGALLGGLLVLHDGVAVPLALASGLLLIVGLVSYRLSRHPAPWTKRAT